MIRRRKPPRPLTPLQEYKRSAPLAIETPRDEQINTSELEQPKVHPIRDDGYRLWLTRQRCSIFELTNQRTGQKHVCWSPEKLGAIWKSDPMHGRKLGTAIKGGDETCFSGCRHAHREQGNSETSMDRFDQDYGINRAQIAARQRAEYLAEQERRK